MTEAWVAILTGLISAAASLAGVLAANRKNMALISYRLEQLEKKQDKHNNAIERLTRLEGRVDEVEHDMTELKRKGA